MKDFERLALVRIREAIQARSGGPVPWPYAGEEEEAIVASAVRYLRNVLRPLGTYDSPVRMQPAHGPIDEIADGDQALWAELASSAICIAVEAQDGLRRAVLMSRGREGRLLSLRAYLDLWMQQGRSGIPTAEHIDEADGLPMASVYLDDWGSFARALYVAGPRWVARRMQRDDYLEVLHGWELSAGRPISSTAIRRDRTVLSMPTLYAAVGVNSFDRVRDELASWRERRVS